MSNKLQRVFSWLLAWFLIGWIVIGLGVPSFAKFEDVPENHPYLKDIQYLEDKGIIEGAQFEPDNFISREVFSRWLLKNAGFSGENYKPSSRFRFLDVPIKDNSYAPFIYRLADMGVLQFGKGKPLLFHPKKAIGRREALQWIFFVEGIPAPRVFPEKAFPIKDVNKNAGIAPIVYKAVQLGILKPGRAHLQNPLRRKEAARFLKTVKSVSPTLTVTVLPTLQPDIERNPKFDVLAGVWTRIMQDYLRRDEVKRDDLVYGAIEGMVKELGDKHSDFERPGDNSVIESLSGQVEGIGAVLQEKDNEIVVITPIVGSPAERAGLAPNDIITAVDDVEIKGMSLKEVVSRIKGKKGTKVTLTIRRGASTMLTFVITRDIVKIISTAVTFTDDNIAKIKMTDFGEKTEEEFKTAVTEIEQKKPKGIVLDLRNNPGGFLNTALTIAGYFIKAGDTITTVHYPDHDEPEFSSGKAVLVEYKIVVLVNGGSASASEILAGALQDYKLARVIGEKTYGKGTVQELSDFLDGSTLKLTIAEWLTPLGRSIEKNGIAPDIEVKLSDADRKAGLDPQMEKAIDILLND